MINRKGNGIPALHLDVRKIAKQAGHCIPSPTVCLDTRLIIFRAGVGAPVDADDQADQNGGVRHDNNIIDGVILDILGHRVRFMGGDDNVELSQQASDREDDDELQPAAAPNNDDVNNNIDRVIIDAIADSFAPRDNELHQLQTTPERDNEEDGDDLQPATNNDDEEIVCCCPSRV